MQWKAIYDTKTGFISSTVAPSGKLVPPTGYAIIDCEPYVNGSSHKVNLDTLTFEEIPVPEPTVEDIQAQIDALEALKAQLIGD